MLFIILGVKFLDIYKSISTLKGVGEKTVEKLNKIYIFNILDLLLYFPRDYEYVNGNVLFEDINENEKQILSCKVKSINRDVRTRNGKIISSIDFEYDGHRVVGKWFNQPYVKKSYIISNTYNLVGKYKKIGDVLEVMNPNPLSEASLSSEIIPKYPLKSGISDKLIIRLIGMVLDSIDVTENLPRDLVERYKLVNLDFAIREIHLPKSRSSLEDARRRLKFQELFTYSLKILLIKKRLKEDNNGNSFPWNEKIEELKKQLPYELTNAQTKVVREILIDQKRNSSMNRLVQGDVGSGKTVIALIAIYNVYSNGYKAALMVPTEILASQHFEEAKKLYRNLNVDIEILTGSTSKKEKTRIKERLKEDGPIVIIGTHALIQEDVEFNKLGLIITDEQHRFGVEQRSRLINKGTRVDCIVMTATPIPRTLALYLYSDLDVSVIDELPPGRKKVDTRFFTDEGRNRAYNLALDEIRDGRQVYIVCPLIEEDEKEQLKSVETIYNTMKEGIFKDVQVAILHGKMKPSEKEDIINEFKIGKINVLISTTVIEVGVNVPNASVMIVENAERFGLSQLHQLRGRVGRGEYKSYCFLIANAKSNATKKRMEIMTESNDGFYISEQDLKLRGSGELFGVKQSGGEGLVLADIYDDVNILKCAMKEAKEIMAKDDEINRKLIYEISTSLEKSSKYICFN